MSNLILDNISLILLLPLWVFLIIMGGRFFSVYVNKRIIYILTLLGSLLGAGLCSFVYMHITNPIEWIYPFIKINNFTIDFGLRIDKLSLIMALTLFVVSFCVQLFSVSYMREEKKKYRFFALLNLFNFSMAFLLFSPNLFQMYVFWELVGVVSYFLIGFDYKKQDKSIASKRVFIVNRIGDTALIAGILIISYFMYTYSGNFSLATLSFEDLTTISALLSAYNSKIFYIIICSLFVIAAMVKSAQFPFHTWLQDAMRAHLPVSALLHSATMVALGIYLTARMMPFFVLSENVLHTIYYVGIVTAVICSILACLENKPKKVLAYSTSANLGMMFIALGCVNNLEEAIMTALLLFVSHALIKSALFLSLPKRGKNISYRKLAIFSAAAISLLIMMPAKDLLCGTYQNNWLFAVILFTGAIYILKLAMSFAINKKEKISEPVEEISSLLLLLLNFIVYILVNANFHYTKGIISYICIILAFVFILILLKINSINKFILVPKFIEGINNKLIPAIYGYVAVGANLIENKVLSNYKAILLLSKGLINLANLIENNIMNKSVELIAKTARYFSSLYKRMQNGNVQAYNAYAFILFTVITVMVILSYTLIFSQMN